MKRTIICLAAKRSGTTAVHTMFVNHPDVGVCHPDQSVNNWEPNFWNLAADVLADSALGNNGENVDESPFSKFKQRMGITAPHLNIALPMTDEKVFEYWDSIVDKYGPIVFDKSPNYLHSLRGLDLLLRYIQRGADVRVFGLIRDPRDVISSQYELWKEEYKPGTPQFRDSYWVEHYHSFERFQEMLGRQACPLIRYEDFASDPKRWGAFIFEHCGVADVPQAYAHIRPVHVGRYEATSDNALLEWDFSNELKEMAGRYGYVIKKPSNLKRVKTWLKKKMGQLPKIAGK